MQPKKSAHHRTTALGLKLARAHPHLGQFLYALHYILNEPHVLNALLKGNVEIDSHHKFWQSQYREEFEKSWATAYLYFFA